VLLLAAFTAAAQQRPIFDPDDFIHPKEHAGPVFLSRLVLGGAGNFIDDYRPLHHAAGFVLLANSIYWSRFQFDYKHSEVRSGDPVDLKVCGCNPPIYFPTPPPHDATPAAPPPGSRDTAQLAVYLPVPGPTGDPIMLRYRLTVSRQAIDPDVTSFATGAKLPGLHGHEQSFGLDGDTYFHFRGHDFYGSFAYARTTQSGTIDDRTQNELAYTSRFPGKAVGPVLFRTMLTVGAITGRGAGGINLVNPYFEAYWREHTTRASLHIVWSPQAMRSRAEGWGTHHQVAVFIDRALVVKIFRKAG
jgi:hypothetical protein